MINFARIKSHEPTRLSKRFSLQNGKLTKEPGGALAKGTVETLTVPSMNAFAEIIHALGPSEALTFGVPLADGAVVARALAAQRPDAITRTRDGWHWPDGAGLLLLDYDPAPGEPPIAFPALWATLVQAAPELATAPCVAVPSASSCIHTAEGEEKRGIGGWHLFVAVADAGRIPEFGATITGRLWLAGHGRIVISKSGALLERTLIDTAVWQPERLSFDGGASLGDGLVQKRLDHLQIINGSAEPLDRITPLTQGEHRRVKKLLAAARTEARPEADHVRSEWAHDRAQEIADANPGTDREHIKDVYLRAAQRRELLADFVLVAENGTRITVGEVLADPELWDAKRFHDPLEPDYGNDPRIAKAMLRGGKPRIHSFAHGGASYFLKPQQRTIELDESRYPAIAEEIADHLATQELAFDFGGLVAGIDSTSGAVHRYTRQSLAHVTEQHFSFTKLDRGVEKPSTLPSEIAGRLLDTLGAGRLRQVKGISAHPVIVDGGVVSDAGLHHGSGVFLATAGRQWRRRKDVGEAVRTLWRPLSLMPFSAPEDAGAAMSLLLTAVARPTLPLAPLFLTSAPTYGSGKTLIAQVAAIIAGTDGGVSVIGTAPEEQSKALLALLLSGRPAVILDNLSGVLKGDAMAAMLTGEYYRGRILGESREVEIATRTLLMATGVNIQPGSDLVRRCITIRLDPGEERPELRQFPFQPGEYARTHREELQSAALTILAASHGHAHATKLGSFGEWDRTCRGGVLWLIEQGLTPCEMADPLLTIARERESDPEIETLRAILHSWRALFWDGPVLAATVVRKALSDVDDPDITMLRVALEEAIGGRGGISTRAFSSYLRRNAGRVVDGLTIRRGVERHDGYTWRVVQSEKSEKSDQFSTEKSPASEYTHVRVQEKYRPEANPTNPTNPIPCPHCAGEGCSWCQEVLS